MRAYLPPFNWRARRRVLVLDSGKPRNRFAQFSHGLFGHDGQPLSDTLANARSQLLSYGTVSFAEGLATHAAKTGKEYTVTAPVARRTLPLA